MLQERGLPTRTPNLLRESSRRLESRLMVIGPGPVNVTVAQDAENLALEAVELLPGDPRPWQALAEACDAQGLLVASTALGSPEYVARSSVSHDRRPGTERDGDPIASNIYEPLRSSAHLFRLEACWHREARTWSHSQSRNRDDLAPARRSSPTPA